MLRLVLATSALRLWLASATGLGIDESYMVAAGRVLRLSYFDHPPTSWWLARGAALTFGSEAPGIVRLPFVALFAASTWLMFAFTRRLFGDRAGMWAAVALNLSPVLSVTTGTWVLPDGPLVCALLGMAYALVRALEDEPASWRWWLMAGVAAGLALLSKYSAALVLLGGVAYLFSQRQHRAWLARPQPYAAAAVALVCCTPVIAWNAEHGWISFAFQGGRAAGTTLHPLGPLLTLAGEALFVGPWIWLPLMLAWIAAVQDGRQHWRTWLPACLGALPVVLFVVMSFWARHVLYHWAAPGYLMLLPLLGLWAATLEQRPGGFILLRRTATSAGGLLLAGIALLILNDRVNVLAPFGIDPGLQALDWTPLRAQLAARDLLPPGTVLAATNWQDAGKLDYAIGGGVPVIVLNSDARQYLWSGGSAEFAGADLLIVGPKVTAAGLMRTYGSRFESIEQLPPLRLRDTPMPLFRGRHLK